MKKISILFYLLSFVLSAQKSNAQIVAWQFGSPASAGSEVTYDATTNNPNLNTSVLSRGSGIAPTSLARAFSANGFTASGDKGNAITNNQYYTFSINTKPGFKTSLSTLDATLRRSASGPNAYIWQYSTDGTTFTDIGNDISFTSISDGVVQSQINLSSIVNLQNVPSNKTITFRLYAWGATATGGTFAIGRYATNSTSNSLAIGGSVISSISTDATLSNLSLSSGSLNPAFSTENTTYTASVTNDVTTISVTPTANDANATIMVNGNPVSSGTPSTDINLNVGDNTITTIVTAEDGTTSNTYTITVNRIAAGSSFLTTTSPLADFGNICINTLAGPNSFTLDGGSLDGTDISIAALPGFSYSETAGGFYNNTLSFSYTGNSFTDKVIYVKFNPTASQAYDGDIILNGGGITNYQVPATGSGINDGPTVVTGSASTVGATTATVTGSITADGCSAVISYGIEYSTATGFPNGTGTQMASSNLSAGNFSVDLSSLEPNVRYYYKAYASNNNATVYGAQEAFTCTPLPVKMSSQAGLTFTEDFSDIANWGSFFSVGVGANHWNGLSATTITTGIPNGTSITTPTTTFKTGSAGGVQKGTDQAIPETSIVLLSTGSPDNNSSTAIDFYLDFTGVNANTVSFDYETLNNSTGNRNGSLRVYTTTDGVTFTELVDAGVLSFTNNSSITGSKTNIILPAGFNNSPTARLRFYYHNGSGGTGSGSRPKISIDNLKVTAVATTPCVSPTAPATGLTFGTISDTTIAGSFTGTNTADNYIVVMSNTNSLTSMPVDGQIYDLGDNVGDGTVIFSGAGTNFTATGLTASSTYYFFVFPVNSVCTGGPLYYNTDGLTGSASTVAGLPPCDPPSTQPTSLTFSTVGINSIQGSFTATSADGYLVLRSLDASLTDLPVTGQAYNGGNVIGNAVVVQTGSATSFEATGLAPDTKYYFYIFSLNSVSCVNGPAYNTNLPLNSSQTTMPLPPCNAPVAQPKRLTLTGANTAISGNFNLSTSADNYLVIRSLSPTLTGYPLNNTDYNPGDNLGGGIVVSNSANNSFLTGNLSPLTTYYFYVFASNKNCSGGTKYLIVNPLSGNTSTTGELVNNIYFGNLHSHSDYSDGNQDNLGGSPAISYDYAKTALCLDYLGISEHNHFSTAKNPGNRIATYHLGSHQADSVTLANPTFLALYGMEWGVISGGGHVVIYGDKMDDLFGWETGPGAWGPDDNYDVYVPKNTYTGPTGLFKTINDYVAKNTFATLAHPNLMDYNNLTGTPYDMVADDAIVGSAVESGPATSHNTTYSNPGSSLYYLPYFETMLSKGYHLGPTIDHDNHNTTFGRTTYSRTAIVAPALTKTEIIKAMRNMHFYATQDCDSKVDFSINTQMMGSIMTDRFAPNISVTLSDITTNTSTAKIRLLFGIPGSGVMAVPIDSTIGNTYTFTDNNLANTTTGYYFIEIENGISKIVTSPIWYTRRDNTNPLPVKISGFEAQKEGTAVKLSWTTEQEVNTRNFVIERSNDGLNWNPIQTVNAAGNSSNSINYTSYDNSPLIGINYYRLKQVDNDGKWDYSIVKSVVFNAQYQVTVTPNPATDFVNIKLTKSDLNVVNIKLINVMGVVVKEISTAQTTVQMKVNNLAKGTYFIKVTNGNGVSAQKLVIQ